MSINQEAAVYIATDICRLFRCGINEIPDLVSAGTIPNPMPAKAASRGRSGKRRWSRAVVDKKLGIVSQPAGLAELVAAEVARILSAAMQGRASHEHA